MQKLAIFREYDIRGIYNQDLTRENVMRIGYLIGERLKQKGGNNLGVGYDARVHSLEIFMWFCQGVFASGIKAFDLGRIPTPVAYFSLYCDFKETQLDGSVMITGSHNPPEYNGFKITLQKEPFFGEDIYALEKDFYTLDFKEVEKKCTKECAQSLNALELYNAYLVREFSHLKGLNIPLFIDCGNGVAGIGIENILKSLNIPFKGLFLEPDGTFPNHHPDPSEEKNLEILQENMKNTQGIGFAFDGDGDRLAVLKDNGGDIRIYKGDELAIIFAHSIKNPIVIGEVKCSQNMYNAIEAIGTSIMYKTGHSNLKVKLKETNAHMAFEVSGHIFFNDRYFGYDDATYAALRVLEIIQKQGMEFDRILADLPKLYVTPEIKIDTQEEEKFLRIEALKKALQEDLPQDFPNIKDIITIDGVRVIFEEGFGLIRASNTTPVLVTRFEATSKEKCECYQNALLQLLERL